MTRVGFLGIGGSGKTTLVQYLIQEKILSGIFLPSCVSRILGTHGILSEKDFIYFTPDQILLAQLDIFYERVAEERRFESFISDRTLLDIYVHTMYRCSNVLQNIEYRELQTLTYASLRTYDYLFYVDPPLLMETPDSKRLQTIAAMETVQLMYLHCVSDFCEHNRKIYILPWCSLEERSALVKNIIAL